MGATGGCGCGACRFRCQVVAPTELQHCYCRLCRQLSGAAYVTWVPVQRETLQWEAGVGSTTDDPDALELVRTTPHGQRHQCSQCGSVLTIVYDGQPDLVWPAAGCFDVATPGFAKVLITLSSRTLA